MLVIWKSAELKGNQEVEQTSQMISLEHSLFLVMHNLSTVRIRGHELRIEAAAAQQLTFVIAEHLIANSPPMIFRHRLSWTLRSTPLIDAVMWWALAHPDNCTPETLLFFEKRRVSTDY